MVRKPDPYPRRGTLKGEEIIGICSSEGCKKEIPRGSAFRVLLGDALICEECYERFVRSLNDGHAWH